MFLKSFWKSITWSIIIIFLSCTPGNKFKTITLLDKLHIDKIVHFIMYFILTIYLINGFDKYKISKRIYILPVIIGIFFGGIIEIIQANFILYRSGDLIDFLFNSIGAIIAYLCYEKLNSKKLIL